MLFNLGIRDIILLFFVQTFSFILAISSVVFVFWYIIEPFVRTTKETLLSTKQSAETTMNKISQSLNQFFPTT